jgi:hypothetical protein
LGLLSQKSIRHAANHYLAQRGSTGEILHFITWIKEDRQYIIESLNTGNLMSDIFKQKILNLANSIAENQGNGINLS